MGEAVDLGDHEPGLVGARHVALHEQLLDEQAVERVGRVHGEDRRQHRVDDREDERADDRAEEGVDLHVGGDVRRDEEHRDLEHEHEDAGPDERARRDDREQDGPDDGVEDRHHDDDLDGPDRPEHHDRRDEPLRDQERDHGDDEDDDQALDQRRRPAAPLAQHGDLRSIDVQEAHRVPPLAAVAATGPSHRRWRGRDQADRSGRRRPRRTGARFGASATR